jgi:ATP-dependent protease ClpP protease subunit
VWYAIQTIVTGAPFMSTVYVSFSAEINIKTVEGLLGVIFNQINQGATEIYLMISTPGGHVAAGMNAYNVLKSLPVPLTTHNVGSVDSIGNAVFLAGVRRYACDHATFMFHGVSVGFEMSQSVRLDEKTLREYLGSIDADHTRIAGVICGESKIPVEKVKGLFLEAQTKDANFALANGLVQEVRPVSIPSGAPLIQLVFQR